MLMSGIDSPLIVMGPGSVAPRKMYLMPVAQ